MNIIQDIIHDTSNRRKHFIGGVVCGACLTVLFAAGVASGMEWKDWSSGGVFDWKDWWATVIGGIMGQAVQLGIIYLLI